MNSPDSRKRLTPARKIPRFRKTRESRALVAELRRQCKLMAATDHHDADWQQLIHLPERVSSGATP